MKGLIPLRPSSRVPLTSRGWPNPPPAATRLGAQPFNVVGKGPARARGTAARNIEHKIVEMDQRVEARNPEKRGGDKVPVGCERGGGQGRVVVAKGWQEKRQVSIEEIVRFDVEHFLEVECAHHVLQVGETQGACNPQLMSAVRVEDGRARVGKLDCALRGNLPCIHQRHSWNRTYRCICRRALVKVGSHYDGGRMLCHHRLL